MKVIIAGSRHIHLPPHRIEEIINDSKFQITEIVCGEARGIDTDGETHAKIYKIPCQSFPADWKAYGRAAGAIRNKKMAIYADALILIWDGESRGSANMRKLAQEYKLPIHEVIIK